MLIGRHIGLSEEFENTPNIAINHNYNVIQIFISNPQQYAYKQRTDKELQEFKEKIDKHNIKVFIHSAYTINLCQETPFIKSLIRDLEACEILNAIGCVIHMGHYSDITEEIALNQYIKNLKYIIKKTNKLKSLIILETGASQGIEAGSKMDKLGYIYKNLSDIEQKRVGICIDTCHIWVSGYDISTKSKVDDFFKLTDKNFGNENIVLFHFNDSYSQFNSHIDRHMNIGYGTIPEEGLMAVFQFAKKHNIPLITETPSGKVANYKTKAEITFEDDHIKLLNWNKNDLKI